MAEEFVQNSLLLEFEVSVDEVDLSDEEEWSEESENEDFDGSWVGKRQRGNWGVRRRRSGRTKHLCIGHCTDSCTENAAS